LSERVKRLDRSFVWIAETTDTRNDQKTNTDWIGYIWQKDKSKTKQTKQKKNKTKQNKTKAKQNKNKQTKIKFDISQSVTGQAFLLLHPDTSCLKFK
jgi:hypothetical protein